MFLKSISMQGFKSFPDRTDIVFDRGITGVVGPNGSGKSNIVDAIRWVLGEQSTKSLRGGKMEDVIFGGTPKRNPLGFCEVDLVLDNSDHALNSEHDEVIVTRRYYRSGESEYFLNRKTARLKDINELFMDTGIGKDGYSIIEQGGIDKVLSAKSTDRRELFEEAAGISRFRYRKDEAERKLESCRENLLRAEDIISELESRIEPLKEQAEKAKSYLIFRDEMRALEVSLWLDSLDKLRDNLKKAQTDFQNAERIAALKKEEIGASYEKIEEFSKELSQNELRLEALRAELSDCEARSAQIKADIAIDQNDLKNVSENIEACRESRLRRKEQAAAIAEEKDEKLRLSDELLKKAGELKKSIASVDSEIEKISAEKSDMVSAAEISALKVQRLKEHISEINEKKAAISRESELSASRLSELDDERAKLSLSLAEEKQKALNYEKELEELEREKTAAENSLTGIKLKAETRRRKKEEAEALLGVLRRRLESGTDRLNMLRAMEKDYQGYYNSVRSVMQARDKKILRGIFGPISSVIRVENDYVTAIEAALGSETQNIVTEDEDAAKKAIRYLKSGDLGVATFRPLTAVKAFKNQRRDIEGEKGYLGWCSDFVRADDRFMPLIRSLLGSTALIETLDQAVDAAKKYGYGFRIVTMDGQIINPSGSMTGGSAARKTSVLSRSNEIDALGAEMEKLKNQCAEAESNLQKAAREYDALTYDMSVSEEKITAAREKMIGAEAERRQHDLLLSSMEERLKDISVMAEGINTRDAEAKDILGALEAEKEQRAQELETAENEERSAQNESENRGGMITGLLAKRADIREELSSVEARAAAVADQVSDFSARIDMLNAEGEASEMEVKGLTEKAESLRESINIRSLSLETSLANAENIRASISSAVDAKLKTEGLKSREERENQQRNEDLVKMQYEVSRLENKKTQAEMEENVILDKMWTSYELTRSSAAEVRVPIENVSKANRRVSELRSSIKALGDVNVGAIDEYAEVGARYEFLTSQRKDILDSKAKVETIISDLESTMKSIFSTEFNKISAYFDETFIDLFGGGHAKLVLEDENDILNCGIEIKVEIPGKTMKVLSLLSGGEKAFVAIALYFSIIKARPTPFCIMDEIEAALDEVNVGKYAAYLHRLNDKTQFIAITHRRGTMEASDVLYGVTMQEQGVTRLLALNVNEAEKRLKIDLK